jgi:hypothetical protein
MSTLVKAGDVPVASRRDYWMHTLDEAVGPLDLRTEGLDSGDWLRFGELGAVRVVQLSASSAGVARLTPSAVRRSDPDGPPCRDGQGVCGGR